jgi:hypothetical protein
MLPMQARMTRHSGHCALFDWRTSRGHCERSAALPTALEGDCVATLVNYARNDYTTLLC